LAGDISLEIEPSVCSSADFLSSLSARFSSSIGAFLGPDFFNSSPDLLGPSDRSSSLFASFSSFGCGSSDSPCICAGNCRWLDRSSSFRISTILDPLDFSLCASPLLRSISGRASLSGSPYCFDICWFSMFNAKNNGANLFLGYQMSHCHLVYS